MALVSQGKGFSDVGSQLVAAGCFPLITTAITVVFQVGHTNIDTVAFVGDVQVIYEDIAPLDPTEQL